MGTCTEKYIMYILPCRSDNTEVLVEAGEFDIFPDRGHCLLHLPEIHGELGFFGTFPDQVKIPAHDRELVPDVMTGDIRKQVEFLICQLKGILGHLNIGYVME